MKSRFAFCLAAAALVSLAVVGSCENALIGEIGENLPPEVWLSCGPVEGDTTAYEVHFYWGAWDPDGCVAFYELVLTDGDPIGFNEADTTGIGAWSRTEAQDSILRVSACDTFLNVKIDGALYSRYHQTHTLFLRAVDGEGKRSTPVYRSFTAWTLAPFACITVPRNPLPGQGMIVPPIVRYEWSCRDPLDSPVSNPKIAFTRHMLIPFHQTTLQDLNANPAAFEECWGPWHSYLAAGDSGISTVIGDDELLRTGSSYVFAVQAQDEAGAVTAIFDATSNVRIFSVLQTAGPLLRVSEAHLGAWTFLGVNNRPPVLRLPMGFELRFAWLADASSYGGEISSYRYGWDIRDVANPDEWECDPSPYMKSAPIVAFSSGIHTLFVEATDNSGVKTIGMIEINVFSANMERNLLWVDDFYSTDDFNNWDYAFPTETQHDEFWLARCARALDFRPDVDVYDSADCNLQPPDIELLWRYKNIIWSYSAASDVATWDDMVRFTPESWITSSTVRRFNYLSYYMEVGGHIWTEGKSDKQGGLIAVLEPTVQYEPINLRCEIAGIRTGCDGDTSGVRCIAYKDYCVSVIDKIVPNLRPKDSRVPTRRVDWDAMSHAYRDPYDEVTLAHPELPTTLRLWDKVTAAGMYFDPLVRGFTFAEVYNPGYWMEITNTRYQGCFCSMYRMKSLNVFSPLNNATIAFWTTKHAEKVALAEGAVAAPSVHFGVPLWYFNRAQVDSIADVVFREWGISAR